MTTFQIKINAENILPMSYNLVFWLRHGDFDKNLIYLVPSTVLYSITFTICLILLFVSILIILQSLLKIFSFNFSVLQLFVKSNLTTVFHFCFIIICIIVFINYPLNAISGNYIYFDKLIKEVLSYVLW